MNIEQKFEKAIAKVVLCHKFSIILNICACAWLVEEVDVEIRRSTNVPKNNSHTVHCDYDLLCHSAPIHVSIFVTLYVLYVYMLYVPTYTYI